jgi:hypothetical protein
LTQIARDGDRPSLRQHYLFPAVWPVAGSRHENSRY